MNVLVSGGTGLIGSALIPALRRSGHEIMVLTRRPSTASLPGVRFAHWDPETGVMDAAALDGAQAIVHLAGESIAGGRWTDAKRSRIVESRVQGTRFLAERAATPSSPPSVFVSASAVGFYGNRGDEILTEESAAGSGFLADVCRAWEAATAGAAARGIRVVHLRVGLVLDAREGALGKMLPLFRLGLGGPLGRGRQWMSWVAMEDVVGAIEFAIGREDLSGPVNIAAPEPARNRDFALAVGRALGRPARLPAPAFALRLLFGRMADEAILASARVSPVRLLGAGYAFRFPSLGGALANAISPSSVRLSRSARG